MKKKLLAILLALVLCLALVAAVACDPKEDDPNPTPGPSGDIPTEEGKVTLYWNVVNTTELTEITSYFLCGGLNGWTQGNTDYEFKRIADTNTYYVFADPAEAAGSEYKVLIGYNSKSPVEPSAQGPFWANEGYGKTWSAGGSNSVVPEFTGNTVNCGTIEFDGCLGDPVPVTNFDVKVSIMKGQLDTSKAEVYIMGHFSSWANMPNDSKIKAVLDDSEDNNTELVDVYKIHVDSMYAKDNAEYLVLIFPNGIGDKITKEDGSDADMWAYFNRANSGAIKVCDFSVKNDDGSHGNAKIAVTDLYSDDYMTLANTTCEGDEAKGLDLSLKVENVNDKKEGLGNYDLDINAGVPEVEVTLTVTFSSAVAEDLFVYLAGEGLEELAWNDSTLKLTATDDTRTTFTVTVTARVGTTINFKVVICGATWSWDVQYGDGESNASVTIEEEGELALFEDTLTYPKA